LPENTAIRQIFDQLLSQVGHLIPSEVERLLLHVNGFLRDENGAITVDYTVLAAGAVAMAISATVILTGAIDTLTGRIDSELRERQLNDSFIAFDSSHFEPLYANDLVSESDAEALWNSSNSKMNQELIDQLEAGITAIEEGTITEPELAELFATASVAYQRNIIDDAVLNYYFGFDGSAPSGGHVEASM
jgi:Flp pilus assembly pilin Flp